jgi:opacity protein-like surface antigen
MKIHRLVGIILASLSMSLAQAQDYWYFPPGAGPYFRAGVGPSFFQNGTLESFTVAGSSGPANAPVSYDTGVAFDAAFGYAFNKYIGLDFDTGYIWTRIDSVQGYQSNHSTIANVPILANATLSLPIPHTDIVPYIGGGAGGAVSVFDGHTFNDGTDFVQGEESDTVFAYQAFAGVRFTLGPNVSVGVGYKYFATADPTFSYPPSPNLNVRFSGIQSHSVLFTLQVNF